MEETPSIVCRDAGKKAEPAPYCLNISDRRLGIISHYQFGIFNGGDAGGVNGGSNVSSHMTSEREAILSSEAPYRNGFCAQAQPPPFDFFPDLSNDMMGMFSQTRFWDRPIDETQVRGYYPQRQHQQLHPSHMMTMQQSEFLSSQSNTDSTASITPQVSAIEPSSSVAGSSNYSHYETILPPFIDFLGVGAT